MAVIKITEENFDEQITSSSGAALVDFFADWCSPCRTLAPVIEEIAQSDSIRVGKVNIDEQPALAERFGVMSVPTLIFFKDGKAISASTGVKPRRSIEETLRALQ